MLVAIVSSLLALPAAAWAQGGALGGTIAGVVRDPSGAVLPGVTVEASSPAGGTYHPEAMATPPLN